MSKNMKEFHWRDKIKHLILSFIITLVVLLLTDSFLYALGVVVILTVIKEIYDQVKKDKNTFYEAAVDVIYNFVGLGLGYLIYHYLIK